MIYTAERTSNIHNMDLFTTLITWRNMKGENVQTSNSHPRQIREMRNQNHIIGSKAEHTNYFNCTLKNITQRNIGAEYSDFWISDFRRFWIFFSQPSLHKNRERETEKELLLLCFDYFDVLSIYPIRLYGFLSAT